MRPPTAVLVLVGWLVLVAPPRTDTQNAVDGFVPRTFTGTKGLSVPYRLFVPDATARARPLPVVMYLHGAGGAGTDNLRQIAGGNTRGTHAWTTAPLQAQYPAFVVAPQIPEGTTWHSPGAELGPYSALVLELLTSLSGDYSIDPDRVYLVGQSLGGFGTWDLISKRPDVFAAAVPLCGGGSTARVAAARLVAIWAFHGALDQTVPVARSRDMVAALRAAGSPVKYTEYPDVGHDVWTRAFAEQDLPGWLFAQKRLPRRF